MAKLLMIDHAVRYQIGRVKRYAEANVFHLKDMKRVIRDPDLAPGNNPRFVVRILPGYRVVLSVEEQPNYGLVWHVSISDTRENGNIPDRDVVNMILKEFGIPEYESALGIWVELNFRAVNLLLEKQ